MFEELRDLLAKATQGRWVAREDGIAAKHNITAFIESDTGAMVAYGHLKREDRDLIVALQNALIDHLESDGGVEAMREACAKVAESFPTELPHVIHVPSEQDITSMGTPYMTDPYDYRTTRRANGKDIAAAIRALPVLGVGRKPLDRVSSTLEQESV